MAIRYPGVHIDIGGPLRVSDREMYKSENVGFKEVYSGEFPFGLDFLEPMESWQLYGIFSKEAYIGFMKAALAVGRSGKSFPDFMKEDNPIGALGAAIHENVRESDTEKIERAAGIAKNHYMANQSRRLAEGAVDALSLMKENGVQMSIITSVQTPDAIMWVRGMKLDSYFEENLVMGNSPEGAVGKDEKTENLINATEIMGLPIEETIYVGDAKGDMSASGEAGCHVALIRKGMTPPALFDRYMKEMPVFREGENFFMTDDLLSAAKEIVLK